MANTAKSLARGAFASTSGTIYTVPTTATTTVVTNITICNDSASAGTFTLTFDGTIMFSAAAIAANTTTVIDTKQVLDANATPKIITGLASSTSVKYHISGLEIA